MVVEQRNRRLWMETPGAVAPAVLCKHVFARGSNQTVRRRGRETYDAITN